MASGASSVILNMAPAAGDSVWLEAADDTGSPYVHCRWPGCVFSGFLLAENYLENI